MLFLIADAFSSSPELVHIFRFCVWLSYRAIKKHRIYQCQYRSWGNFILYHIIFIFNKILSVIIHY